MRSGFEISKSVTGTHVETLSLLFSRVASAIRLQLLLTNLVPCGFFALTAVGRIA